MSLDEGKIGPSIDDRLGRLLTRSFAGFAFLLATFTALLSWRRREEFDTFAEFAGTLAVFIVLVAVGRWLWRMKRPLSKLLDT